MTRKPVANAVSLLAVTLILNFSSVSAVAQDKLNVVVILADDQGWGDLSANGRLFDIAADRGQHTDVASHHPDLTTRLLLQAKRHAKEMNSQFEASADRPFTVGYGPSTSLMARDGVEHGTIQRSAKAPNNSFFTHWTRAEDSITWDIDNATPHLRDN